MSAPNPTVRGVVWGTLRSFGRQPVALLLGAAVPTLMYAVAMAVAMTLSVVGVFVLTVAAFVYEEELVLTVGWVVLFVTVLAVTQLMITPFMASLMRAQWMDGTGEHRLGFGSGWRLARRDLRTTLASVAVTQLIVLAIAVPIGTVWTVVSVALGDGVLGTRGIMLVYCLALVPATMVQCWTFNAVALHRTSLAAAVRLSARFLWQYPWWTLRFVLVYVAVSFVLAYVPFLGLALLCQMSVQAYAAWFGDPEARPVVQ